MFDSVINTWTSFSIRDFIDIIVLWALLYRLLRYSDVRYTSRILGGSLILIFLYAVSLRLQLETTYQVLHSFFKYIGLIVILLFPNEIKKMLHQLGGWVSFRHRMEQKQFLIDEVIKSVSYLKSNKTGALIVFENKMTLDPYLDGGLKMDSRFEYRLVGSIFHGDSPLHDGAIVIKGERLNAAGCFLPLTDNPNVELGLGTRHRAALGLSEKSDATIVVLSEESGDVSLVHHGEIYKIKNTAELSASLNKLYKTKEIEI